MIAKFFKKKFRHFIYFYGFLRYRMFVSVFFSMMVGLLDGLGLAMFIPMFQLVSGVSEDSAQDEMGAMAFVVDLIEKLGFSLNLNTVLVAMLLVFSLKGMMKFLESFLNAKYRRYFINKLRISNIVGLSDYQYVAFVKSDSGRIQNTVSGEINNVNNAYKTYVLMLQKLAIVSVYIVLAYLSNPKFAFMVTVGGVLTNLLYKYIYKLTMSYSRKITSESHGFQGMVIQMVALFKYLKSVGMIRDYGERIKRRIIKIENLNYKQSILSALLIASREPMVIFSVVAAIFIEVNVFGGSLGLIILSLLFFYRALTYITNIQTDYNKFLSLTGSLENMKDFMNDLSANAESNGTHQLSDFSRELSLKNVSFSYGGSEVLKNIDLEIAKNETVAFVGESGSGKTTLLNIVSGLLSPAQGTFEVDGVDFREIDKLTFQRRIGYITQEPIIFDDSIFNNVTLWDEYNEINRQRFEKALKGAAIFDFLYDQPDKEHTRLGSNGIMVSGGQKQRICIARELYKDIDILLLDEATSALDSETEKSIKASFEQLKGHYTMIVIAHRLSTIRNVDRVCLMDKGEIRAIGTYDELVRKSPDFSKMVNLQEV